jgi:RNA polymerase sigma factor (sigma-70 family)
MAQVGTGDAELCSAARAGDAEAFGRLFERHVTAVYNYCFRRTASWDAADDLTSLVFLEAWRRRDRLVAHDDAHGGTVLPWLYGIATNVCHNQRRSIARYRRATARLPLVAPAPDHADDVAGRVDDERAMADVLVQIGRLSAGERDVVALVAWQGLDYAAAAAALGVPIGTVRSRLSRARARLTSTLATPHLQEQP